MKILHTADWHLDAPLQGQPESLRQALSGVPGQILELVQSENCDMVLPAGDLFDGAYTPHTYRSLYNTLEQMAVPVFIAPGNHDFCAVDDSFLWVRRQVQRQKRSSARFRLPSCRSTSAR